MPEPTDIAKASMDSCTDDTSHVFVQDTGELWVMSVWNDPDEYVDKQGRCWHWQPDPRPPVQRICN